MVGPVLLGTVGKRNYFTRLIPYFTTCKFCNRKFVKQDSIAHEVVQGGFFSTYRRISADFPRIFDPPEISTNLGRKWTNMQGVYAFHKHPKLPKNGPKQSFSAPEIHRQNPPCSSAYPQWFLSRCSFQQRSLNKSPWKT